jgi:pimeloyl-ACP methyl ester carboxylesterase
MNEERRTHIPLDATPKPEQAGGCPPPLTAAEVSAAFESQCENWTCECGSIQIDGRTWGQGKPLYLLNGIGGTLELFAFLVWLLRDEFRCVVFDYPSGDCQSPAAPSLRRPPVTADLLADALFAAADRHGDRSFSLFAMSFGSLVALSAMLRRPERIDRAVIQGGFARRSLSRFERLLTRLLSNAPGRYRHLPLRRLVQQNNHRYWFPPFDARRWNFLVENTGRVPIRSIAERAAIIRDADLRPKLRQIAHPVLLVHSEGDGIVSEECHRELADGLPNARSEWLSHCGHIPAVTHPHRLATLIRGFLLDVEPPAGCAASNANLTLAVEPQHSRG